MRVDKINYVISKFKRLSFSDLMIIATCLRAYVLRPHLRNKRNWVPGIQNEIGSPCSSEQYAAESMCGAGGADNVELITMQ